jgi:hypothetical protein
MDRIENCVSSAALALVLLDMIAELCEDGMPTAEAMETWLLSYYEGEPDCQVKDTYNLENYDSLCEGDVVYYIDNNGNVLSGKVFSIKRDVNSGRIAYLSVDAPNDFCGFAGDRLGKAVFINNELAEKNNN